MGGTPEVVVGLFAELTVRRKEYDAAEKHADAKSHQQFGADAAGAQRELGQAQRNLVDCVRRLLDQARQVGFPS